MSSNYDDPFFEARRILNNDGDILMRHMESLPQRYVSSAHNDPFVQARKILEAGGDTLMQQIKTIPRHYFKLIGISPPSSCPTAHEVQKEARRRSHRILEDWSFLQKIVERYETTLEKRWLKKTKDQRRNILLIAWPNMATRHRPDIDIFFEDLHTQRFMKPEYKDAFLCPYINLEDLLKPKTLLLFLHTRSQQHPNRFADADFESCEFGRKVGALKTGFLYGHSMMFNGRTSSKTYGEILAWQDYKEASDLIKRYGMVPGHGLWLLEAQERLYSFLVEVCKQILHEMTFEQLTVGIVEPKSSPPAAGALTWQSLAVTAAEAPYRLPPCLNFSRLQAIVAARRTAAQDHIWALRDDPGYFVDVVVTMKEHDFAMLPDIHGHPHVIFQPSNISIFWNRLLGNLIDRAYLDLEMWTTIYEQVAHLRDLQRIYSSQIKPDEDLPQEYSKAFHKLYYLLEQAAKRLIQLLIIDIPASPPLRPYFVRQPQAFDSHEITVKSKVDACEKRECYHLLWICNILWNENRFFLVGLDSAMDQLGRLMEHDQEQKKLITSWIASIISDLTSVTECIHQIKLYKPWATSFESDMADRRDEITTENERTVARWPETLHPFEGISIATLGRPLERRFYYPVDKRRSKANTEAMRHAEENLDAFWRAVDRYVSRGTTRSLYPHVMEFLARERILQRTPEWVDPKVKNGKVRPEKPHALCKPLSELYFDLEYRTEQTVSREAPHASKIKTSKRDATQSEKLKQVAEPLLPLNDVKPTFFVDKRALKVFSVLFFNPVPEAQPGEIPWTDFLHAMVSTGFAVEKLYGSVWQFTPNELDVVRSIQFHEPHPGKKIPFHTARRHGRRLFRAYGWHGGMFELQ